MGKNISLESVLLEENLEKGEHDASKAALIMPSRYYLAVILAYLEKRVNFEILSNAYNLWYNAVTNYQSRVNT